MYAILRIVYHSNMILFVHIIQTKEFPFTLMPQTNVGVGDEKLEPAVGSPETHVFFCLA